MPRKTINPEAADDFDVPERVPQQQEPLEAAAPGREADALRIAAAPADKSPTKQSEVKLPDSLRESFDLLRAIEAQPAATRQDEEIKAARLAKIKRHVFQLQQMPVFVPNVENMHLAFKHQNAKAKEEKLKALAREHPEVAELAAENKKLREQLERPKK